MSGFSPDQLKKLVKGLDQARIHRRELDGRHVDYIEGWFAIAEANAIFGYAGWDREMAHFERVFERAQPKATSCGYLARVRIRVRAGKWVILREGTGFGHASSPIPHEAHERALKAAETDATKRALATFGNRFGLSLYDKDQSPSARARELTAAQSSPSDPQKEAQPGVRNIFELKSDDGTILAAELSPEGFCSGLRQMIEAAPSPSVVEGLRAHNKDAIGLLRQRAPELKSARGEHYADILETLITQRASVADGSPNTKGNKGEPLALPTDAPKPMSEPRPLPPAASSPTPLAPAAGNGVAMKPSPPPPSPATIEGASPRQAPRSQNGKDDKPAPASRIVTAGKPNSEPARAQSERIEKPSPQQTPGTAKSRIAPGPMIDKSILAIGVTRRVRNKAHLVEVGATPCLVCEQAPCHAHHVTFAQPRGLSVKVSDEFTVPLCALHHNELHRAGNEEAWWRKAGIDPLAAARAPWDRSLGVAETQSDEKPRPAADARER